MLSVECSMPAIPLACLDPGQVVHALSLFSMQCMVILVEGSDAVTVGLAESLQ